MMVSVIMFCSCYTPIKEYLIARICWTIRLHSIRVSTTIIPNSRGKGLYIYIDVYIWVGLNNHQLGWPFSCSQVLVMTVGNCIPIPMSSISATVVQKPIVAGYIGGHGWAFFPDMDTTSSPNRHEINRMSHHNESFRESSFSNKAIGIRRKIDKNFQVGSDNEIMCSTWYF